MMTPEERKSYLIEIILENYAKKSVLTGNTRKRDVHVEAYAFLSSIDKSVFYIWKERYEYLRGYYNKNLQDCRPLVNINNYIDELNRVR